MKTNKLKLVSLIILGSIVLSSCKVMRKVFPPKHQICPAYGCSEQPSCEKI